MAKGYWITFYHYVANPAVLTEYVKLATPVVQAHRGRFLSRGMPVKTYEAGLPERSVVVEFDSVQDASLPTKAPSTRRQSRFWEMPNGMFASSRAFHNCRAHSDGRNRHHAKIEKSKSKQKVKSASPTKKARAAAQSRPMCSQRLSQCPAIHPVAHDPA